MGKDKDKQVDSLAGIPTDDDAGKCSSSFQAAGWSSFLDIGRGGTGGIGPNDGPSHGGKKQR
jgi:hypothetical protein